MIEYAAVTNKGMVRESNQDFYHASTDGKPLFLVCDGMGGHASGDVASRSTALSVSKYIEMHAPYDMDDNKARELLVGACKYANSIVLTRSKSSTQYSGMGTTCDICLVDFDILYICHVGDSRVYLLHDTELSPLTQDHTLIEELVKNGTITPQEAETHPNRHMITRAVGTEDDIECDFIKHELSDGDIILMCTDGLTNMLSETQIKRTLLTGTDLQSTAQILIDRSNESGGIDNITAIVIKYSKDKEGNE